MSTELLNLLIKPHRAYFDAEKGFVLRYRMTIFEKIVDFFFLYVSFFGNLGIGWFEIYLIQAGIFRTDLTFLPLIHFVIASFSLVYLYSFSPVAVLFNHEKIIIKRRRFFGGYITGEYLLTQLEKLDYKLQPLKGGGQRMIIHGFFKNQGRRTLFRFRLEDEKSAEKILNEIKELIHKLTENN